MNPQIPPYQQGSLAGFVNRAQEIRRDNDSVKVPEVNLFDVDYSVLFHLSQQLNIQINDNGRMIPIPVMFGNAEKWSQIRQYGFMRDNEKKALAPVILINRGAITQDERFPFLDGNLFNPMTTFTPSVKVIPYKTMGMQYDREAGQYVTKPSYEYYVMDVPTYVKIQYELIIWTDLMEQMNNICHTILEADGHVWGDYNKFRTLVLDVTPNNVNAPGDDRILKSTINLEVHGVLRKAFEYHQSTFVKQFSVKRVEFLSEQSEQEYFASIDNILPNTQEHLTNEPPDQVDRNLRRDIRFKG